MTPKVEVIDRRGRKSKKTLCGSYISTPPTHNAHLCPKVEVIDRRCRKKSALEAGEGSGTDLGGGPEIGLRTGFLNVPVDVLALVPRNNLKIEPIILTRRDGEVWRGPGIL